MKLEKKTQVVGITLNIKGKEIELTIEEAKELKEELTKLFAEPVTVKEYVPYYPYIPYEPYKPYIWCSPNTTSGSVTITNNLGEATSNTVELGMVDQYCNSYPTTATCGARSFENVTVGGM